jgi:membrane-associated protein
MYGIPILGGAVILQCNGIPTGANYMVIAAGSFAYAGEINLWYLGIWVWLFNIIGDSIGYLFWKGHGHYILDKLPFVNRLLESSLKKTSKSLEKYGHLSLVITRFPLSGFGPPMNILTGLIKYGFSRFLIAIIPGELLWTAFNLGMGYWFGDSWETIGQTINQFGLWFLLIVALLFVIYMLIRQLRSRQ